MIFFLTFNLNFPKDGLLDIGYSCTKVLYICVYVYIILYI